jgi:hypothetical protein
MFFFLALVLSGGVMFACVGWTLFCSVILHVEGIGFNGWNESAVEYSESASLEN